MTNMPSAIALLAATTFTVFAAVPSCAAESSKRAGSRPDMQAGTRAVTKGAPAKPRRGDREAARRIVTYNLFHDPVFKLNGALADKRQLGAASALERQAPPVAVPKPATTAADTGPLKLAEPEVSGIDFGCSDKPFRSSAKARELTACYKHNVDRAWKTQTYLSREYSTEGSQKWGGGLAVRYAY